MADVVWQRRNRIKRIVKRRIGYMKNFFGPDKDVAHAGPAAARIEAGDIVRVRSREEIGLTLNRWNQLKGCSFMEEMWPYCGTTQRVLKRVERFLDERDYLLKKCNGIVILDGVFCQGTRDFGACDRTCYFFWREEWLEGSYTGDLIQ
jgi:hypothetical protein